MRHDPFLNTSPVDLDAVVKSTVAEAVEKVWSDEARAAAAEARQRIRSAENPHQAFTHGQRGDGQLDSSFPTAEGQPAAPAMHKVLTAHGFHPITQNPGGVNYGNPKFPHHAIRANDSGSWAHSTQFTPTVKPVVSLRRGGLEDARVTPSQLIPSEVRPGDSRPHRAPQGPEEPGDSRPHRASQAGEPEERQIIASCSYFIPG